MRVRKTLVVAVVGKTVLVSLVALELVLEVVGLAAQVTLSQNGTGLGAQVYMVVTSFTVVNDVSVTVLVGDCANAAGSRAAR